MKLFDNTIVDKKTLTSCVMTLVVMSALAYVTSGLALCALALLAMSAIVSGRPEKTFWIVVLTISLTLANFIIVPKNAINVGVMRGTLVLVGWIMIIRIAGSKTSPFVAPVLAILPYLIFMAFASFGGWCPIISELKIVLFTSIFLTLYSTCDFMLIRGRIDDRGVRAIMLSIAIYYIVGSTLLLPFPGLSMMNPQELGPTYNPQISLFKGMANHSQSLGPILAGLGTLLVADLIFCVRRISKIHLILLLLLLIPIYKTSSRTAMGTLIAGCSTALYLFMGAKGITARWRQKIVSSVMFVGIIVGCSIIALPSARTSILAFVEKKAVMDRSELSNDSIGHAMLARSGKAEECMHNFRKSPMIGNGFQVSEDMQSIQINAISDILSAPIEKGFMWAAILEESGAIGMTLFVIFVLVMLAQMKKMKAYVGGCAFIALIVSNTGEFSIFSLTYTGGLMWSFVFIGLAIDGCFSKRLKWSATEFYGWLPYHV